MSQQSQQVKAVDRQVQALKMRQAGASYDDIARVLGYK
jgi:transcriptional regulator